MLYNWIGAYNLQFAEKIPVQVEQCFQTGDNLGQKYML